MLNDVIDGGTKQNLINKKLDVGYYANKSYISIIKSLSTLLKGKNSFFYIINFCNDNLIITKKYIEIM